MLSACFFHFRDALFQHLRLRLQVLEILLKLAYALFPCRGLLRIAVGTAPAVVAYTPNCVMRWMTAAELMVMTHLDPSLDKILRRIDPRWSLPLSALLR